MGDEAEGILVPRAYDLLVSGWIVQQLKKKRWGSGDENEAEE